jgi:hypothetical protein
MEDIIGQIPLEEYFLKYIQDAKPDHNGLNGLCPFHDDKKRSFSVNLKTSQWKCHAGCGEGNIISFHARVNGIDTRESYQDLVKIYNLKKKAKKQKEELEVSLIQKFANDMTPAVIDYLTEKRGWSSDVIKKCQIGYIKKQKRVSIPVFDGKGKLVNIRRYKPNANEDEEKILSWKKGTGQSRLYPIDVLNNAPVNEPIILSEGEPDTLCGLSHELWCITQTAGAETWKSEFNKEFEGRHVITAYDNDTPGKKGTLKAGIALLDTAVKVETVQWPEYMEEKEDLTDFFVKYQKTKEDFLSLPRVGIEKPVVENGKDSAQGGNTVIKENGCYWSVIETKYSLVKTKISNFTLKIIKTFHTPEGAIRSIRLISENGFASKEAEIKPEEMAGKFHFAKWCFAQGNFQWKGTPFDLENVWTLELSICDARIVYRPDHIGEIEKEEIWLLGDYAVKEGRIYTPNSEGIIWIEDNGYQPMSLNVDAGANSGCLPLIRNDLSDKIVDETQDAVVKLIKENIGGYEAYLALGFIAACVYSNEIYSRYKFPILFISGKREVGKNTLARIIVNHFGLEEEVAKNISDISNTALMRWLAYYSGIPLWLDEFRNTNMVLKHESTLRSVYDRIGGGNRGRLGFGVVGQRVRAPLVITGEGYSKDSALASRCVRIQLSLMRRKDEVFKQIETYRHNLSGIVHRLIVRKSKQNISELYNNIDTLSSILEQGNAEKGNIDPRLAKIYASLAVCFIKLYDTHQACNDHGEFLDWLKYQAFEVKKEKDESFILNEFFYDAESLRVENILNGDHVEILQNKVFGYAAGKAPQKGDDVVRIWLRGIYNKWAESRKRRGEEVWSYYDLLNYLKDEEYYIEPPLDEKGYAKPQLLNGKKRRCFDLSLGKLPEGIRELFLSGWHKMEETDPWNNSRD